MNKKNSAACIRLVKFDPHGLVPAIVQDYRDNTVLMVAYMNKKSLAISLKEGKTCFWSRSRKKLWRKGETSGNRQIIKSMYIDCDGDCLLFKVRQIGRAACHTGYRSCFFRHVGSTITIVGKRCFDPSNVYKK